MKTISRAAIAAFFMCALSTVAHAETRFETYPAQVPQSTQANALARNERLARGTLMRDILGAAANGGLYADLSVVPNGGMYLAVQPTASGTPGTVYQLAPDDPLPLPQNQSPQLPADPTLTIIQGVQTIPVGGLGPLTAPNSGNSQYYLVEAQLQTVDTSPLATLFEDTYGNQTTKTVNTQRVDQIVYQVKAGLASATPTVPTVDSGWVSLGTVLVPSGTTAITSAMIVASPPFGGFVANGSALSVASLAIPGISAGCLQANGSGVVSSLPCTSGVGTVNGTFPLATTQSSGVVTVTCATCVTSVQGGGGITSSGGTTPTVSLAPNGPYAFGPLVLQGPGSATSPTIGDSGGTPDGLNFFIPGGSQYGFRWGTTTGPNTFTQLMQLGANGLLTTSNNVVVGGRDLTLGSGSSNATVNAVGGAGLFLNYTGGSGGISFCAGSSACPGYVSAAGNFFATSYNSGNSVVNATGITSAGTVQALNGIISAPLNDALQLCANDNCNDSIQISTNGTVTIPGLAMNIGTASGNGQINVPGSAGLYINFSSGTGGVNFCNGAQVCNAAVSASGSASARQYSVGNALSEPYVYQYYNGANYIGLGWNNGSVAGVSSGIFALTEANVGPLLTMDGSGNLGVAGGLYEASQRKLKNNIVPLLPGEGLALAERTQIVRFCYKTEHCKPGESRHIGFIADDTDTALAPHHKSMDVSATAAAALDAAKTLHAELREDEASIATLQKQVAALQAQRMPVVPHIHEDGVLQRMHDWLVGV